MDIVHIANTQLINWNTQKRLPPIQQAQKHSRPRDEITMRRCFNHQLSSN